MTAARRSIGRWRPVKFDRIVQGVPSARNLVDPSEEAK